MASPELSRRAALCIGNTGSWAALTLLEQQQFRQAIAKAEQFEELSEEWQSFIEQAELELKRA